MRIRRTSTLAAAVVAGVLALGGSGAALAAQHGGAMNNGGAMHHGKKHKHKHGHAMHHGGAMHQ